MSAAVHRCVRCGIDIYIQGGACRDCWYADDAGVRALTGRRPPLDMRAPVTTTGCGDAKGTVKGMYRHHRRGEDVCDECRAADAARSRTRRAARRQVAA